jgi:serine/threonine protein kinase
MSIGLGQVALEAQVDQTADLFEHEWKTQGFANINAYLRTSDAGLRRLLLEELIYIDCEYRCKAGEAIRFEDYRSRFAELAACDVWARLVESNIERIQKSARESGGIMKARQVDEPVKRVDAMAAPLPENTMTISDNISPGGCAPARIGRYIVLQQLQGGGQAEVFRVAHPDLPGELVLKRFLPVKNLDVKLVQAEAVTLAKLRNSPGIARVYDAGVCDGFAFVVVEYVEGRNLEQYALSEKISADRAIELVTVIARGLGAAHRLGIAHLDVKPRNIVVDTKGEPKLIDFGIARIRDAWKNEVDSEGLVSGTPAYMSPEQALGQTGRLGPASDVFSVGGVLYYLLTRRPLYEGNDQKSRLQKAQDCAWDRQALKSSAAPRQIKSICEKALSKLPEDRYPNGDAFAGALESFRRLRLIRRWALAASCAAILLIGASIAWSRFFANDPVVDFPVHVEALHRPNSWTEIQNVSLSTDDSVRIRATLPEGRYATVFKIDATPGVTILQRISPSESRNMLVSVPRWTLHPNQTELVGVFLSRHELSDEQISHPDESQWPPLPAYTVLHLGPDGDIQYFRQSQGRDIDSGAVEDSSDKVRKQMLTLRQSMAGHIDGIEAVAFVFGADDSK